MLTLEKTDDFGAVSVPTDSRAIEDLLTKEWLLTNGRGTYASSTIIGCNTSAYHGLLIGSLRPPINRIMALANCLEMIISNGQAFHLSTFEFNEKFAPTGVNFLRQFRRDGGVHFDYELQNVGLTKSVYLLRDTNTVAITYAFIDVRGPVEFVARPFVGLRDFHTVQKSYAPLYSEWLGDMVLVRHDMPNSGELFLGCPSANFEHDQQWWFNFVYRKDRERGQEFMEDLWTPGFFKCRIDSPTKIVLWANLSPTGQPRPDQLTNADMDTVCENLRRHSESLRRNAKKARRDLRFPTTDCQLRNRRFFEALCVSADAFVTARQTNHSSRTTILAGYPWFADWGRDAFISLPGLLLITGRFDEAQSVLTTFAAAADAGMIPNRFDDNNSSTYFNSVDASLWFINAAFQYLQASGDSKTFMQELMPTIHWIMDSYRKGTRFGIHADSDGLITAGDDQTQLTWMDAKYDGVAFTPRCGKAVEVSALWYNCLCLLAQFYADRNVENAERYKLMADRVRTSFCELFWNESLGYLNDCILPDGSADSSLRPNQIFAVSLPFSPLSPERQKLVVDSVQEQLLTPYGLRTLSPVAQHYKSRYTGHQRQRDEAYHQGTVWPYLVGPFVEAYLKVNDFSRKSKKKAYEFIQPLLHHLTDDACLGNVSEIFDGDPPHNPKGCFAQAWSVAELIRAYHLINS